MGRNFNKNVVWGRWDQINLIWNDFEGKILKISSIFSTKFCKKHSRSLDVPKNSSIFSISQFSTLPSKKSQLSKEFTKIQIINFDFPHLLSIETNKQKNSIQTI